MVLKNRARTIVFLVCNLFSPFYIIQVICYNKKLLLEIILNLHLLIQQLNISLQLNI